MERKDGTGVRIPPPALFIVVFFIGLWLEGALYRIRMLDTDATSIPLVIAGMVLVTLGVLVALWGVRTFKRHKTAVMPYKAARILVRAGPYRYSRNPMYLGMTLAHLGGAVALNAMWPIILLPMALVLLFYLVIRKEEEHLWRSFGDDYVAYRSQVRRWA
jgi:protein-S-isoprenylcysteine O-methyltransferase Ste14